MKMKDVKLEGRIHLFIHFHPVFIDQKHDFFKKFCLEPKNKKEKQSH